MDGLDRKHASSTAASVCRDLLRGFLGRIRQYVDTFGLLRCELPDASFHARVTEVGLLLCGLDVASRSLAELSGAKNLGTYAAAHECLVRTYRTRIVRVPSAKYLLSRDPDGQAG